MVEAEDLSEIIAALEIELSRLGLSKNGMAVRLMLKSLGLPKWSALDRQQLELVLKILRSVKSEPGMDLMEGRIDRLERAFLELVDGHSKQPAIQSLRNDRRLKQTSDFLLTAHAENSNGT